MATPRSTVFITGGTSGIGRGLAEAFSRRGDQVIITGRREDRLREICDANPGMLSFPMDVSDPRSIADVARRAIEQMPAIDTVINNAGVQKHVSFAPGDQPDEELLTHEIQTNLLGPMRVAAAFIPHLTKRAGARLINVSSGLAFVPLARFPIYCATKAAVHSWTLSLRHQLRDSGIRVIEIIPPWVATELGSPGKNMDVPPGPNQPIPLDAFIEETMRALDSGADELPIDGAKRLADAASAEKVRAIFSAMNP